MSHWHSYTSYSLYFDGSDMTDDETEFLLALASYQKRFERRYPTWLEVLNVLRCLGYRKVAEAVPIDEPKPPAKSEDPSPTPPPRGEGLSLAPPSFSPRAAEIANASEARHAGPGAKGVGG